LQSYRCWRLGRILFFEQTFQYSTSESSLKARMWDNMHVFNKNEFISIDMVLIDEEVSI
jgi:hypothetical protein